VPTKPSETLPAAAVWLGGVAFALVATLNAGGYRYGASDQAFYIPAILHHLDPALFPRDWAMLGAQGRYFFVDEAGAWLVELSGWGLPAWFAIGQAATLAALYGGALSLGRTMLGSPWALTAWIAALTLRHRIARTGVNTLEGYFHPRMLVFGLGVVALAGVMHGRRWWPVLLLVVAAAIHPTTAALFLVLVFVAMVWAEPRWRAPAVAATTVGAAIGVALVSLDSVPVDLTPMDATWRALVATKDYTFPTRWTATTWLTNLLAPAVLGVAVWQRHRDGRLSARELGLVAGCVALLGGFLLSLPLIAAGVPLAVQLQTSRAFWPVEAVAVLYLVWLVVERPLSRGTGPSVARAVAVGLVAVSVARGGYVGFIESPERPVVAPDLPDDNWTHALTWIRTHTPADTLVLADPGHAWKPGMGTAIRIGAARDVYLEETKDVAMAMYSREAAHQVVARIAALQGFADWPAARMQAAAAETGARVLVERRTLDLPVLFTSGDVRVYDLAPR